MNKMTVVTKKCYYSNISKFILFYFYSRKKRSADNVISDFQSTFNTDDPNPMPKGNMYMKMFGRDMHYSSFNGTVVEVKY